MIAKASTPKNGADSFGGLSTTVIRARKPSEAVELFQKAAGCRAQGSAARKHREARAARVESLPLFPASLDQRQLGGQREPGRWGQAAPGAEIHPRFWATDQ